MTRQPDTTGRAAIAIGLVAGMTMPVVAGDLPNYRDSSLLVQEGGRPLCRASFPARVLEARLLDIGLLAPAAYRSTVATTR